jgi:hypothetical protein
VIFSSNIIRTPKSSRDGAKKKRERERKGPRVSSNKGEVNILRGKRHINFKKYFFNVISFSPPLSYHFKNPFQNH